MFYLPSLSHKPIPILLNKYAKIHLLISFIYKYVSSSKKVKQAYFHIFRLIFITFFEIHTLTKDDRIYYSSQYIKSQENIHNSITLIVSPKRYRQDGNLRILYGLSALRSCTKLFNETQRAKFKYHGP